MRIIYEANDGTQFNTSEECERHEYKSSILLNRKNFLCFDEFFHPIELHEGNSFTEIVKKAYFFICFTKEAVEIFQEKVDESDESDTFPYIHKDILYGWAVDNNNCWSNVWEVVEELEKQSGYLRGAVCNMYNEIEKAKQGK